jgi:hypothetical protein
MKKCLLLFAVLFTLASCSLEGDEERADFNMVFIAADSIAAPEYVVLYVNAGRTVYTN